MDTLMIRRSVRKFTDKEVEPQKIDSLLRAAMQAPSAGNGQPWEFIVVQDKENLKKLSQSSPYAGPAAGAPLCIVVAANRNRSRYPEYWQQDCSAAAQNILIKAVELGLGGVWLAVSPDPARMDFFQKLYKLPKDVDIFAILPLGYPIEGQGNKFTDRYDAARIHREVY